MSASDLCKLISTFFYIGFIPGPSGTWGSLAGLAIYLIVPRGILIPLIPTFFALGTLTSHLYSKYVEKDDPKEVVVDEVVGMWIALLPSTGAWMAPAFFVFRAMDILKPFPIGWIEKKLRNGLGIMADDVLAGAYTALAIYILKGRLL